uniref:Nuclear pore complex protein n=1 Tax=Lygus hesperus TaxID=30085 RepID=A0A146KNT1_LYGHE
MDYSDFTMSVGPLRSESRKSKIRKSFVDDLSLTIGPDELSGLIDTSATAMTSVWGTSPIQGLHKEFQRICTTFSSTFTIFDAVQSFIEECDTVIEMSCKNGSLCDKQGNDLSWLVNEKNTWRLIYALYRDRAFFEEDFDAGVPEGDPHPQSEKEIMENFYRMNRSVREAQLVIDWLERNAQDEWKLLQREEIAFYTDKTVAWENTLFQLQNSRIPYGSTRQIVKSLDPDAPTREGRPLHDLDAEDEKRLLRQVFAEIRKGNIDKAQEICIHCGQAWRAATLDGWRLFHDPNYAYKDTTSKLPVEGNPHRPIWKMCAWKMCEDSRAPPEDKAVMGALCGHLPSILPYCTSWEDLLWAHTKVSVDVAVEQNIRDNSLKDFPPMPPHYWNYERKIEDILREIGSSEEGRTPIRVIQELLIVGQSSELLSRCAVWVEGMCQPQFLRFLAHVVLVLRMAGYSEPDHLGDDIIKAYIKSMFEDPDPDLIAFYCTKLSADDQVELYSEYLETVSEPHERQNCLRAAEKFDLKVSKITERVVHKIRNQESQNIEGTRGELVPEISEDDAKKISALEWMMFYSHQRAEAMWETNAIVRNFIAHKKLTAARLALLKVPPESPEVVLLHYNCTMDEDEAVRTSKLPPKANSAIKEYLCLKAYVDAHESFSMWFHQFHNTKPSPPTKPPNSKDFTENIAYEHRLKRHHDDLERWRSTMIHQTQRLQKQFNNIIVFPDGWLVDRLVDEEPRKSHLERLRSLCIPEICMLLINVLSSMELYTEIMNLMGLLMDESSAYYKVFSRQQLRDLTCKVKETSLILLKNEGNPFGEREEHDSVDDQFSMAYTEEDEESNQYWPERENFTLKSVRLGSQAWHVDLSELLPYNATPTQKGSDDEEDFEEDYAISRPKSIEDDLVENRDAFVRIDPEMVATYVELQSKNRNF